MRLILAGMFLALYGQGATAQLQTPPSRAFQFEVVDFKPEEGHHFELAASQDCSKAAMISKEKTLVRCQFLEVGDSKLTFNVCDDQKTFCKPYEFSMNVEEKEKKERAQLLKPKLLEMKERIHQELIPDFQSLNVEDSREKARLNKNAPTLVLVSTDWCPPCNQSKEYLLSTKEFREFTRDWVKIYVDGDAEESASFDVYLPFFEYPSFILVNSEFKEIARFREEFTFKSFSDWWERVRPYQFLGYEKVSARVSARMEGDWFQFFKDLLFFRSKEQKQRDLEYVLETSLAKGDEEFVTRVKREEVPARLMGLWLKNNEKKLLSEGMSKSEFLSLSLKEASAFPSYYHYLGELCSESREICAEEMKSISARTEQSLSREDRSEVENLSLLADEFYARMSFFKKRNQKSEVRVAARKCMETFESLTKHSALKFPRYSMQGLVACAKEYDLKQAERVYLGLIDQYPEDATFKLNYARFLKDEIKDLKRADQWVTRALSSSYDYNWFFAASLKVQISRSLGEVSVAKKMVTEALDRIHLDANHDSRNHKLFSRFKDLEKSLSAN